MKDDVVWARVTDILRRPNVIAEQLGEHRGDGGLERDLAALDKRLADIATKQTNLAQRLALVSDDAATDAEKLRTLADWCRHVGAKLNNATYEQKRQALEALGAMCGSHASEPRMTPENPYRDGICLCAHSRLATRLCMVKHLYHLCNLP